MNIKKEWEKFMEPFRRNMQIKDNKKKMKGNVLRKNKDKQKNEKKKNYKQNWKE